ncbi:MAG TPA: AIR synthase related protein [Polyangiales bacterium]|nr:AIR synthase related protein [Polyangiales bacterium]
MSQGHDAYAAAGVDYGAVDPGKLLAQRTALDTAGVLAGRGLAEVGASRGESAYAVDLGDRYLTMVTEALGTKNLVADAMRGVIGQTSYDLIARDTVATILNDLATLGGFPVALTAYWASGRSEWFEDRERMAALVSGWGAACKEARCAWGGGETQVLTGMIDPNTVILGGSAVGSIAPRSNLLLGSRVRAGDEIVIAPSTGIHANGLTLARKLAGQLARGYETPVPGDSRGRCYGEVLLDPSPLYGGLVEAIQGAGIELHYTAHITGHGWRKLMRADQPLTYVIDRVPEVPPVLQLIVETARMGLEEAYGTFNMGGGYAFFVAEGQAARVVELARGLGRSVERAGTVEAGPRRVVLQPLGVTYESQSLAIR